MTPRAGNRGGNRGSPPGSDHGNGRAPSFPSPGAVLSQPGVGNLRPVHGEDQDGFGAPHEDESPGDDGPMRGWVPPDDRLWRHPSEGAGTAVHVAPPSGPSGPTTRGAWVVGGLTVCVLLTLVISGVVVVSANDPGQTTGRVAEFTGVPTTEVDVSHLTDVQRMATVATNARASTVALVVATSDGTRIGTGVVAEAGGIIVALQPTVADARSVTVIESDGTRQIASLVGSDPATGIVVLRIADDLPVATFTNGDPSTGSLAMAMSAEEGRSGRTPVIRLYAGTVLYAGIAAVDGKDWDFCGTAIAAPLSTDDLGSPLVEPSGAVAGVFDAVVGTGESRTSIFLPAELVQDVTAQIVSHGSVEHGVLGASVVDAPVSPAQSDADGRGALVQAVAAGGSAASAGIESGDRIVAVDGDEVRSVAELTTRLYADPPGTELPVTVLRSGYTLTDTVILGDS